MRHKIAVSVLMLCVAILTGCGAARPTKFYQLTVPGDTAAAANPASYPVTLLLGPITSSHLYRDDHIVFSSGGQNMGTYAYQRWVEPPTEMIDDVLLRQLRASGRYRPVHSLRSNARGDYLLHGQLYDFKEVSGGTLVARLTLEFEMRDTKTGATVWTHFYTHDEPVSGKGVSAVVASLDRNVQRGMNEIIGSLDQYFSTHPPANSTGTQ
jgi:ABC-type uncharacterized transport system auxiliary subunit